jgi:hypothetical protein
MWRCEQKETAVPSKRRHLVFSKRRRVRAKQE